MKRTALTICLNLIAICAFAQATQPDTNPAPVAVASQSNISISSKGHDVRVVLHDLFTQVKKNYVLEGLGRTELFLSLNAVDFDESLEIVCRLANLKYELQNGIYYITKNRATPPKTIPNTQSNSSTNSVSGPVQANPNPLGSDSEKPTGRLPESVLKRTVKGKYTKKDLREIITDLGTKAKVTILVDASVPKYKLDFSLNTTSLGYALKSLASTLKLKVTFTDQRTILLVPITPVKTQEVKVYEP
jgi:hypothetical protein